MLTQKGKNSIIRFAPDFHTKVAHCPAPRSVGVAIAELGSGHTRDLWLDVQPPEADEVSAEHVRGGEAKKQRHKEEKGSKHAEKLHGKDGKQCRLHLQVLAGALVPPEHLPYCRDGEEDYPLHQYTLRASG